MKLYIGNLPYSTQDEDLRKLLEQFGTVESTRVISDRETGRSKGFGFGEMPAQAEAEAAISALNGQEYEGRKLVVNEARPMTDRPARGPRDNNGGGNGGNGFSSFRQRSW